MTDYFTLTNLIRLLVVGSLAWWLLVDVPRWWRKRQAAKNEWAAKVPKTPKAPKIKLPRKRAEEPAEPAASDEPVIVRRRTLGTIAAEHGLNDANERPIGSANPIDQQAHTVDETLAESAIRA